MIRRALSGSVPDASKLITMIENRHERSFEAQKKLYPHTGKAHVIGITGSPGTGKSTLIGGMIRVLRARGVKIGVIAVDPSSRFSGGAVLADRMRLEQGDLDEHVYIRSMATRGAMGGLAPAIYGAVSVIDAMGKDIVLVETVGVGQNEIDVMGVAHTTLVVLAPGLGDHVQALKSGILEIGDIFVINKADNPGADGIERDIRDMTSRRPAGSGWSPEIFRTTAITGDGIEPLVDGIYRHKGRVDGEDLGGRRTPTAPQLLQMLKERVLLEIWNEELIMQMVRESVGQIARGETDPYSAIDKLLASWSKTK
jgi:LAO/AO transport system kinase